MTEWTYLIVGRVLPEREGLSWPRPINVHVGAGDLSGKFTVQIVQSLISAQLILKAPTDDLGTLRNHATHCLRGVVAPLGFVNGRGYDVEVTQIFDPVGGTWKHFGVSEGSLIARYTDPEAAFRRVLVAHRPDSGPFLMRCLADACDAIRRPDGTGFYCYLAIEALRQYFAATFSCKGDKESWEMLRKHLKIADRKDIDYIKGFADPRRHGLEAPMTYEQRKKALETTWDIIDKFVSFMHDQPQPGQPAGAQGRDDQVEDLGDGPASSPAA